MGFTKLDQGIVASSIMEEPPETFKVFITLLAVCGADGIAPVSPTYLESVCRLSEAAVARAIKRLSFPDPKSRTMTDQGRRIRRVDGGFRIINYEKFREWTYSMTAAAVQKRRYRETRKAKIKTQDAQDPKTPVDSLPLRETEAEAEMSRHVLECPGQCPKSTEPPGIYFDGSEWTGLTPDVLASLRERYPGRDVPMELEKMAKWFRAVPARINPKIERTEFIEKWLRRPAYESQREEKT